MDLFFEQLPIVLGALNTGFIQTLKLFFVTLLGAFPLGLLIAFGSMSKFKPLSYLMKFIVWIVRGTPLMIQMLIIYYFPGLVFHNPIWGGGEGGRFVAASVSFIVNYACYFSEIYRGGIQGIPVGQEEAGLVLGMTPKQIFFKVKLLQMIKKIVPAMSNEIITLVKDTSLAFVLAVTEMFTLAKQVAAAQTTIVPLMAAGVFYYLFNLLVAFVMETLEKKMAYYR